MADNMDERLKTMVDDHFCRIEKLIGDTMDTQHWQYEPNIYKALMVFTEKDRYWYGRIRSIRFDSTFANGILYRPQIVEELAGKVMEVLKEPVPIGIMVKGPQGIGKSHSLVSLVRKLLYGSNNKYLVTFIPDCAQWQSAYQLLEAICESFGTTPASAFNISSIH
jgi:hypothetical protein